MERTIRLIVNDADRPLLFDLLVDNADKLSADAIGVKGTAKSSGRFASGSAEIAEIVIAIGSAGGFTALTAIMREYFKRRPHGQIEIEKTEKGGSKSIKITAAGANVEEIAKSLSALLQ